MTEQELHVLLEVQYLKGRLDELEYKAKPQVLNLQRSRKLDIRIDKYYKKLKNTSELAYHLHAVEKVNVRASKSKSQKSIKELLNKVKDTLVDEGLNKHQKLVESLNKQIKKYE
jgi:hypothetical protein